MKPFQLKPLVAGLACLSALAGSPQPAAAQAPAERALAQARFSEGLALEKRQRWQLALDKYREAASIEATPELHLHQANCEQALGRLADAARHYRRAATLGRLGDLPKVAAEADQRLKALAPRLPYLLLRTPDDEEGLNVSVDGKAIALSKLGTHFPVNPGEHRVEAQAPQRQPFEVTVTLAEGQSKLVRLMLPPKPGYSDTIATQSPQTEGTSPWLVGGVVGLAAGSAMIGGAVTMLVVATQGDNDVDNACGGPERAACPNDQRSALQAELDSNANLRTGGYVLGGAGLAGILAGVSMLVISADSAATGSPAKSSPAASWRPHWKLSPTRGLLGVSGHF